MNEQLTSYITLDRAFDIFENENILRNLAKDTIKFYRDCFNYFRRIF